MAKQPVAQEKEKPKEFQPEGEKKAEHKKSETPSPKKGKGHTPLPDSCFSVGCKARSTRFNFCAEHYEHFKFGLIKKTGEPVLDYEKKFEHYTAYVKKRSAQKVA